MLFVQVKARGPRQVKVSVDVSAQEDWTVVLGESLAAMNTQQWDQLLGYKYIIFARYAQGTRRWWLKFEFISEVDKVSRLIWL